jgi:hypothetical protein
LKLQIACTAAASGADELVAAMLAQLLRRSGYFAIELSPTVLENTSSSPHDCSIICISSISPFAVRQARAICKGLRAAIPGAQMIMGMWSLESGAARQRLGPGCAGSVVTNLADALAQIRQLAEPVRADEKSEQSENRQDVLA